jgi:hypothetical protein
MKKINPFTKAKVYAEDGRTEGRRILCSIIYFDAKKREEHFKCPFNHRTGEGGSEN